MKCATRNHSRLTNFLLLALSAFNYRQYTKHQQEQSQQPHSCQFYPFLMHIFMFLFNTFVNMMNAFLGLFIYDHTPSTRTIYMLISESNVCLLRCQRDGVCSVFVLIDVCVVDCVSFISVLHTSELICRNFGCWQI